MAEFKPGEFLITREQHYRNLRLEIGLPGDDLVDPVPVDCRGEPLDLGPATRADLAELDAVPEPVDSAEPAATYLPGAAPIGPSAGTRPYRVRKP